MLRRLLRLFLLAYFLMPAAAGFLVILTFVQIRNDVTPIYESASATISNAANTLNTELSNLGANFAPLASAVNAIRTALQAVLNFLRDTVYTLIDVVNGLNLACSIGGAACIPKSINITLPSLIDLSFINDISNSINQITTQVNQVVSTTTNAISTYTVILVLAVLVFVAWILLTYVLFVIFLYNGLWRSTAARAKNSRRRPARSQ
ncbi:MAG: hypothetical protein K8L99_13720 [Anaerolineae bacterium]|nr:hypothetical protein [Anaerolineae bacterium]